MVSNFSAAARQTGDAESASQGRRRPRVEEGRPSAEGGEKEEEEAAEEAAVGGPLVQRQVGRGRRRGMERRSSDALWHSKATQSSSVDINITHE